nr:hypothetical protein Iba_chr12bCG11800 [Ipomoea batatas]
MTVNREGGNPERITFTVLVEFITPLIPSSPTPSGRATDPSQPSRRALLHVRQGGSQSPAEHDCRTAKIRALLENSTDARRLRTSAWRWRGRSRLQQRRRATEETPPDFIQRKNVLTAAVQDKELSEERHYHRGVRGGERYHVLLPTEGYAIGKSKEPSSDRNRGESLERALQDLVLKRDFVQSRRRVDCAYRNQYKAHENMDPDGMSAFKWQTERGSYSLIIKSELIVRVKYFAYDDQTRIIGTRALRLEMGANIPPTSEQIFLFSSSSGSVDTLSPSRKGDRSERTGLLPVSDAA